MPCTLTGSPEGDKLMNTEAEVTELARLLCIICRETENHGDIYDILKDNEKLSQWWENHKKVDYVRKKKIKDQLISELTEEQISILRELGI